VEDRQLRIFGKTGVGFGVAAQHKKAAFGAVDRLYVLAGGAQANERGKVWHWISNWKLEIRDEK
jgi:hypothetical protein